ERDGRWRRWTPRSPAADGHAQGHEIGSVSLWRQHGSYSTAAGGLEEPAVLPHRRGRENVGPRWPVHRGARPLQSAEPAARGEGRPRASAALAGARRAAHRHGAYAPRACAGRGAGRGRPGVVSRARDVVEVVARALAQQPDVVRVTESERRGQTRIELLMPSGELGRVI